MIPGIPIQTRISILQQTDADKASSDIPSSSAVASASKPQLTVLEEVIDKATSRNEIQQEIDGIQHRNSTPKTLTDVLAVLLTAIEGQQSLLAPLRAFRQLHHDRLKKELFELDKDARLRSGTRGMAARKALTAFEMKVAESAQRYNNIKFHNYELYLF